MWQGKARILSNEEVAPDCFRMALEAPEIAREARAGQFLHVRVVTGYSPLLRRPFSVHRIKRKKLGPLDTQSPTGVEILYKVVGTGTKLLAERKAGEELDILGPLGNGFKIPALLNSERLTEPARQDLAGGSGSGKVILVAGGIGVAPLLPLAEELAECSRTVPNNRSVETSVIVGAATKESVLCEKDFKSLSMEVRICTEDGSYGQKALASDLLENILSSHQPAQPAGPGPIEQAGLETENAIVACGPEPMLKKIAEIVSQKNIPAQLSLEGRLGCGVGACLGCAVKIKKAKGKRQKAREEDFSYKRICKDGPVFDANEVVW